MKVPTLETERLVLRPWREEDVPTYASILRDLGRKTLGH
jgi:RimJ/RimL family protein N-acetyltransferase